MTMGKNDSTKTRVTPVFNGLAALDDTGAAWLAPLLALPQRSGASADRGITPPLITPMRHGDHEIRLEPPRSLLQHMVRNPGDLVLRKGADLRGGAWRAALLYPSHPAHADARRLAERLVAGNAPIPRWCVFEGRSAPDVYLETSDAVIVIEGKRTEPKATTTVSWLRMRDQMLRHLDCAMERLAGRRLYGLLIVEAKSGSAVPDAWRAACARTVSEAMVDASLPHRSPEERRAITDAFLGATTWRAVCDTFGMPTP